jgi:hypothetical protein
MTDTQIDSTSSFVSSGEYRASAALPGSGAYSTEARLALPAGARSFELLTRYTRGAEGGSWKARLEWYPECAQATPFLARLVNESSPTYATPTMTVQEGDAVLQSPVASGAGAIDATRTIRVPDGMVAVRVSFAEVGVTGTPGTLRAWYCARKAAE